METGFYSESSNVLLLGLYPHVCLQEEAKPKCAHFVSRRRRLAASGWTHGSSAARVSGPWLRLWRAHSRRSLTRTQMIREQTEPNSCLGNREQRSSNHPKDAGQTFAQRYLLTAVLYCQCSALSCSSIC